MKGVSGQLPKLRQDVRLYLFHGPDEAGASDLARQLAATMPEAERIDLDGPTLKKDVGRLADEALSPSLFGEARVIRVAPLGEEALEALSLLLNSSRGGSPVIALAPALKKGSKVLALALAHPNVVSVACYAPSASDSEKIATGLLTAAGMRPAPGVARRLVGASGGDRAVLGREIDKLALYLDASPERPQEVGPADVDAIIADLSEAELNGAVDALLDGRPAELGMRLTTLDENGASPVPWLRAVQRRLVALGDMRGAVDRGEPLDGLMKRHRIFSRDEEQRTARDLRRWSPTMIATALTQVRAAELSAMSSGGAGATLAEHAAVGLARRVAR